MMNVLAISLVLSTLVTAGFLTPNKKEDVVLVVEFDKNDGTKVLISPQEAEIPKDKSKSGYVSNLKDKLYEKAEEASSVLPNIGQGISSPYVSQDQQNDEFHTKPSSAVCDALGKCKEKIATASGKTKGKVEESIEGTVKEKAKDVVYTTKAEVEQKTEPVKEEICEKVEEAKEGARKIKEKGKIDLKDILERGREFFYDVFVYTFSLEHLRSLMRLTHLLGFSVAYGMCIWVTFISSYVLARALPRQQFAVIQSKIYPVYFKAMAYCVGPAFLGHFLSQKRPPYANSAEAVQGFNLLASISMLLVNLLFLEPRATKVMFERLKLEKEEGRGRHVETSSSRGVESASVLDPTGGTKATTREQSVDEVVKLSNKLKKLNSYSSFLNVLTLMALTHHLLHLTQLLDAAS